MKRRCLCRCHEGSVTDRRRADGVDVCDPVEAVTSCNLCSRHHCVALLDPEIIKDRRMIAATLGPPITVRPDASEWNGEDGG